MTDLSVFRVNLDTPQPDGRQGESPRAAFTKYNDLLSALQGATDHIGSAAPPAPLVAYQLWTDTSTNPATIRRRNAANTAWVALGSALQVLGSAASLTAQTSTTDAVAGRALINQAWGLGASAITYAAGFDFDTVVNTSLFQTAEAGNPSMVASGLPVGAYFNGLTWHRSGTVRTRMTMAWGSALRFFLQNRTAANVWITAEAIHTGNASTLPLTGSLAPATDNTPANSLGVAARRWPTVFAASGTINTSDAREKTPVRHLTDTELAAARQLAEEIGAYRWLSQVDEKGDGAREHIGMTVQRAIEVIESHGLDPFSYGFICYDEWGQETVDHPAEYEQVEVPAELDENGVEVSPARTVQGQMIREAYTEITLEAGDRYSFRMDELYAFIAAGANQRANDMEARLTAIEAALAAQ